MCLETAHNEEVGVMNDHRVLLRIPEAAERLALSRSAVYRLIWSGELPVVKIGTAIRIPSDAIREWVEARVQAVAV
jgi:excisionase family DNA binding protein